jgi:two-component system phosphate regulon sensor histidine kinase PhoR
MPKDVLSWLLPRVMLAALLAALGGWIGTLVGNWLHMPMMAGLIGASIAISTILLVDSLRAHRLLEWLRGSQREGAPRDAGIWGELGYGVERAVRQRDKAISRERLQLDQFLSAIEASPNGVLMLDANDQILWCNRAAADHFALDPHRDRLQRVTNLVRSPPFVTYLHDGLKPGSSSEPLLMSNARGPAMLTVLVRPYGDGMKLVLSQDVTERERAEAMRRDFVANVSHEIRTPLTVLSGFVETMSTLSLTEVERKRVLHLMTQQTQRMQALVSDLLTLAQLEGSPRPAPDRWLGLDPLLARVISDAQALSAGRHQLSCSLADQVELAGVESELLSALANLVTNAVRYTPSGGEIHVQWRVQPDGSGEIAVSDNGPGIAREHLSRLTERFYRVDGSRARETGGTGLGLSIVKHVAQRHGGELQIESEVGKGSVFRLVLPAARVRLHAADSLAATQSSMLSVPAA